MSLHFNTTYATNLDQLSKTPLQPELYSRIQYQVLSRYLSAPLEPERQWRNQGAASEQRQPRLGSDAFVYVVVHIFSNGSEVQRDDFKLKDGLAKFLDHSLPNVAADQVVFVRGSLSPAWVNALGTKYKIDPEFFRRHLRYLSGHDYSELPSLPSSDTEMITMSVSSLYMRSHPLAQAEIKACRDKDLDIVRKNQNGIAGDMASGETVIRRFSTLNDRIFSVEHEISVITRSRKNGGQTVVLLDNGLEMNHANGPPCFDSSTLGASISSTNPIPVIVPRPSTVQFNFTHPEAPSYPKAASPNSICHVASLVPFYLGISGHAHSPAPDVLVHISEVLRLVAGAECQFLNRLHCIIHDLDMDPAGGEEMKLAINTLRYFEALLGEHKQRLERNMTFMKSRWSLDTDTRSRPESSPWTKKTRNESLEELAVILNDFNELLIRAGNLRALCKEAPGLILNSAMLRESQKAIQRADDQRRMTTLAYLFLPLSLVSSIFGMNVRELGTGSRSIWYPFAVFVPVGCIAWMLFHTYKIRKLLWLGINLVVGHGSDHHTHGATIPLSNSRDKETDAS